MSPILYLDAADLEQEVGRDVTIVSDMLTFLNESWTPYHATGESQSLCLFCRFLPIIKLFVSVLRLSERCEC